MGWSLVGGLKTGKPKRGKLGATSMEEWQSHCVLFQEWMEEQTARSVHVCGGGMTDQFELAGTAHILKIVPIYAE